MKFIVGREREADLHITVISDFWQHGKMYGSPLINENKGEQSHWFSRGEVLILGAGFHVLAIIDISNCHLRLN